MCFIFNYFNLRVFYFKVLEILIVIVILRDNNCFCYFI